jgi:predicted outer membrane protein
MLLCGMAEVALGKLALTKTTNVAVKDFANMMVSDHGKANEKLMQLLKQKISLYQLQLMQITRKKWMI